MVDWTGNVPTGLAAASPSRGQICHSDIMAGDDSDERSHTKTQSRRLASSELGSLLALVRSRANPLQTNPQLRKLQKPCWRCSSTFNVM